MVICTYQSREKTKVWENSTFERLLYGKSWRDVYNDSDCLIFQFPPTQGFQLRSPQPTYQSPTSSNTVVTTTTTTTSTFSRNGTNSPKKITTTSNMVTTAAPTTTSATATNDAVDTLNDSTAAQNILQLNMQKKLKELREASKVLNTTLFSLVVFFRVFFCCFFLIAKC